MILIAGLILGLLFTIMSIYGLWNVFIKCGEEGWKAIVPFYNIYTLFKIFYKASWFWYYFLTIVLAGVFMVMVNPDAIALPSILAVVMLLFAFWITCMLYSRVAKAFGYGTMYTIGLLFVCPICIFILGNSKDKPKFAENNNNSNKAENQLNAE